MTSTDAYRIALTAAIWGGISVAIGFYQRWKLRRREITMRRLPNGIYEDSIKRHERWALNAFLIGFALLLVSGVYLVGWYY